MKIYSHTLLKRPLGPIPKLHAGSGNEIKRPLGPIPKLHVGSGHEIKRPLGPIPKLHAGSGNETKRLHVLSAAYILCGPGST